MFRVLIVDDDKNTRRLLKAVLEKENYTVVTAQNGEEALDALDKEHVDIILLDIMMPKMDGYEFTSLIREQGVEIPILMLTAKHLPADKHMGFISGADDYMTKPVDETEMLLRIKALLRRSGALSERKLTVGSAELDFDSFTVTDTATGESQTLPQKEFLLLYKLLSCPGKIFTRIQLMDEIWGADSETGWETVTVHIGRLRKRFEGWDSFAIESVRGLGYRAVKK